MVMASFRWLLPCGMAPLAAVALFLAITDPLFGQDGRVIIEEGFDEGAAKPESNLRILSGAETGTGEGGQAEILQPDPNIEEWVLRLTPALNQQFGVAWFDVPFDLRQQKVVFEANLFIWGGSTPPADGVAAIFQLFGDLSSADRTRVFGRAGGWQGVTNMGVGGPGVGQGPGGTDTGNVNYIAIGWDIWDNGDGMGKLDGVPRDDETFWDGADFAGGGAHSANIELLERIIGPDGSVVSDHQPLGSPDLADTFGPVATDLDRGIIPPYMVDDSVHNPDRGPDDIIPLDAAVGDFWGPEGIVLPIANWIVTFESGFVTVRLDEVLEIDGETFPPIYYDPNEFNLDGTANPNFQKPWMNRSVEDRTLIVAATDALQNPAVLPSAEAILGFSAATGGATANQEVDNIKVTVSDNPRELRDRPEAPREAGGVNVGGRATSATSLGDFLDDRSFGNLVDVDTTSDPNAILLTRSCPGFTSGGATGGESTAPIANLADTSLESIYRTSRSDATRVAYTACVPEGRYEVNVLLMTDSPVFIEGFESTGPGSRHFVDVVLEGETALGFFSPAEAAADELGNPDGAEAIEDAAVLRTFQLDVIDGELNLEVLGQQGPATLNGFTWNRIGDATGEGLTGDVTINPCPGVLGVSAVLEVVTIPASERVEGTPGESGFSVATLGAAVDIGTESEAVDLLCGTIASDGRGTGVDNFEVTPVINFQNTGGTGRIGGDLPYPGLPGEDENNFAILAEGWLNLPAGETTVIINSDDGFRLDIGQILISEFEEGRGADDTAARINVEEAGFYAYRITHHEGGGGSSIEFTETTPDDLVLDNVVLVNDAANGATIEAYTTLTDADGNVIDPRDHLFPLCEPFEVPPFPVNANERVEGTPSDPGFNVVTIGGATGIDNEDEARDLLCGVLATDGRGGFGVSEVINFVNTGGTGAVGGDTGYPNLPGEDEDNFALLSEGWLDLPAGENTVVVNSDDGFRLWIGSVLIGEFFGGRGTADTSMTFSVPEAGVYPFRLTHHEGAGGSAIEFREGDILVNSASATIQAWRTLTDAEGNVVDPADVLLPFCLELPCPVVVEGPELVQIVGGLGAAADSFISPLGENCAFTEFSLEATEPLTLNNVTATSTADGFAPDVSLTDDGGGQHTVTLSEAIPPGNWLTLELDVTGQTSGESAVLTVSVAHQPLDVNQDAMTNIRDATTFGDEFRGRQAARLLDINCDGTVDVRDATAFGNNWNGLDPATQEWRNTELPARQ